MATHGTKQSGIDAEAAVVADKVHRILSSIGDDWRGSSRAQFYLAEFQQMAAARVKREEVVAAVAIFREIVEPILEQYGTFRDEEGEILIVVGECVDGLGRCLKRAPPDGRRAILQLLLDVYRWDMVENHGITVTKRAGKELLEGARADEKRWVAQELRSMLPAVRGRYAHHHRQPAGHLILEFVGKIDDEEKLAVFAAASMDRERVELLLTRGDVERAAHALANANLDDAIDLADRVAAAGGKRAAVAALLQHPALIERHGDNLREWLARHRSPVPHTVKYLMDLLGTHIHPHASDLKHLLRAADELGRRAQVLDDLLTRVNHGTRAEMPLRVRALAEAGRAKEAVALLDEMPPHEVASAAPDVARAISGSNPFWALELYDRALDTMRSLSRTKALAKVQRERDALHRTIQAQPRPKKRA